MKTTIRWFFWVMALGVGAILGIAMAGGMRDKDRISPEECIRRLSDPDWKARASATRALRSGGEEAYKALFTVRNPHPEARFRIALLKKELAPLYGSWKHALEAGREAFDGGGMKPALKYFFIAARKNKALRIDPWLADLCTKAWNSLSKDARDRTARLDWQLFLCGEFGYLADHFPESPCREKSLFLAGRYDDVLTDYPEGTYAPLARYSLTSGHPYFEPPAYLEIQDPAGEVDAWPLFLREHPGHPGSDDAAYRMGRALEKLSRYGEAVVWLMRSARLPDGEFAWKGPLRAIYVMDALATEDDLRDLAGRTSMKDIREKAMLTLAVRAFRRGDFEPARDLLETYVGEYPETPFREKLDQMLKDLVNILIPNSRRIAKGQQKDTALYELGRYFYHRVLALYNPIWEGNRVNYFSYEVNCLGRSHAFRNPDYFESHNNYLRASSYFDRLWSEHPESPSRPAALYSAGTALFKASSLNQFSLFHRTRAELLENSVKRYEKLVKEHPDSPLADDAAKMVRVVCNMRKDTWR